MNNVPPTEVSFHFIANTCNVLTEKIDVDMEKWVYDTKLFRKQNYPSMRIQEEEWRTVNGLNVYYIKWQTGDNRSNLQCYSYFAKSSFGVVQLTVSTPAAGAVNAEEEILRLLNGLVLNE
ncbi:MAG: hypothetical protein FJY20_08830 [Bacteroidetes bacterium]|nr:hypothetical protein [Bacteroidota bacterium]